MGADADITIFDPDTVTDNSSLDKGKNALPSTGIPYVIVNGTIVVKDSKVLKNVYPRQGDSVAGRERQLTGRRRASSLEFQALFRATENAARNGTCAENVVAPIRKQKRMLCLKDPVRRIVATHHGPDV